MIGQNLIDPACIMDLQCCCNLSEVVDGEEKVQILSYIQGAMEVNN